MADKEKEEGKPGMQATRELSRSDTQGGRLGQYPACFYLFVCLFLENNIFKLTYFLRVCSLSFSGLRKCTVPFLTQQADTGGRLILNIGNILCSVQTEDAGPSLLQCWSVEYGQEEGQYWGQEGGGTRQNVFLRPQDQVTSQQLQITCPSPPVACIILYTWIWPFL